MPTAGIILLLGEMLEVDMESEGASGTRGSTCANAALWSEDALCLAIRFLQERMCSAADMESQECLHGPQHGYYGTVILEEKISSEASQKQCMVRARRMVI